MPSTAPWARYDPRIKFVIDGKEMPCVRCSVDYELNAIPQASATLAVGRDFNGRPSPAHKLVAEFVNRAPVQIYVIPNALGQPTNSFMHSGDLGLQGGEVRIFDGFVTAAGFTRSRGGAQFNVQMEHWLSELGFSSIFSASSHPMNPGQYSYGALSPTGGTGAAYGNMSLAYKFVTSENVTKDLWGAAIKPFFLQLCKDDAFYAMDPLIDVPGANDGALAAIERFSTKPPPLALDVAGTNVGVISNIMNHIGNTVAEPGPLANQTLWDVLVGILAGEYLFKLVPRVEDARIVPFIPGYRTAYKTVTANEEIQVEWIRGLGRPLRGVGILACAEFTTGAGMPGGAGPSGMGIGGFYTPDPKAKGIIIIKPGPNWMCRLYSPALYGLESTGGDGSPIGTAVDPGGKPKKDVPDEISKLVKDTVRPFLKKYAQAEYIREKLGTRQAVCSGPFRLDIAPGSTLKIENEGEAHIKDDPFKAPFYAHVSRVSLSVDGEQPSIGTSFHLSHIRSEKENGDDKTSIAKHPLYKDGFVGCGLIDLEKA